MKNWLYVGRRLLLLVPQLLLISLVTFTLMRMLPGDPARLQLGPLASDDGVQRLRSQMRLDEPLPVQYVAYVRNMTQGDFGRSWSLGSDVAGDIVRRLPATLELLSLGILLVIVVLVPLGAIAATKGRGFFRRQLRKLLTGYGMLAGAIPDFWLGLIFIYLFFTVLGIAPGPVGRLPIGTAPPPHVTGFYTVDSLVAGDLRLFRIAVAHIALPVLTLALVYGGAILKVARVTTERTLKSDYVAFARSLGLTTASIWRIVFRNAAPPVLVMTGIIVGFLLGGAVLIETVFNLRGLGQYAVNAVQAADYAPMQAFVLVAAAFTMVVYLVVDLIYFTLDPRVRPGKQASS